jgi:hypothetical protein
LKRVPEELNGIVDKVLAYQPKSKTKAAQKCVAETARVSEASKLKCAAD